MAYEDGKRDAVEEFISRLSGALSPEARAIADEAALASLETRRSGTYADRAPMPIRKSGPVISSAPDAVSEFPGVAASLIR